MERFESTTGFITHLIILVLCVIAYARWKHPGWFVLGLWALCTSFAYIAVLLIVWNVVGTIGSISPAQSFCEKVVWYAGLPRDFLSMIGVGLLVLWRPSQTSRIQQA